MSKVTPPATIQAIKESYRNGMSWRELCKTYKVSQSTVHRYIKAKPSKLVLANRAVSEATKPIEELKNLVEPLLEHLKKIGASKLVLNVPDRLCMIEYLKTETLSLPE